MYFTLFYVLVFLCWDRKKYYVSFRQKQCTHYILFGSRYLRMDQVKFAEGSLGLFFLKAVFHKFYLVHSWIVWPISYSRYFDAGIFEILLILLTCRDIFCFYTIWRQCRSLLSGKITTYLFCLWFFWSYSVYWENIP